MRTIVHLSDLHFGRIDPQLVAPLIRAIQAMAPHLVAVSGDLTQRARRREFEAAKAFLSQLTCPVMVVPGNHDVPLYNLPLRFLDPFRGYRRAISSDLEPTYQDEEIVVVGLNSARSLPFHGGGRLNEQQVVRAAGRFRAAPPDRLRIVVTHHPFDLPEGIADRHLIGRSDMAIEQLAASGAALFLAGHLHVSHVGQIATRHGVAGHSALVVQAGTLSMRRRGEVNALNVLRVAHPDLQIARCTWDASQREFQTGSSRSFRQATDGWAEVDLSPTLPSTLARGGGAE